MTSGDESFMTISTIRCIVNVDIFCQKAIKCITGGGKGFFVSTESGIMKFFVLRSHVLERHSFWSLSVIVVGKVHLNQ